MSSVTSVTSVSKSFSHRVTAIIPAAGEATRFGSLKQLHQHNGQSLLERAINAAADAGADPIIVVLGAEAEKIRGLIEHPQLRVVVNENWNAGLASSLAAGIDAVNALCDGMLVTLADQPLVDASALGRLLAVFDSEHRIVASSYGDAIGVPAVFGIEHRESLAGLSGDSGAGLWIRQRMSEVTIVQLDQAALDVDTILDAQRLEEAAP